MIIHRHNSGIEATQEAEIFYHNSSQKINAEKGGNAMTDEGEKLEPISTAPQIVIVPREIRFYYVSDDELKELEIRGGSGSPFWASIAIPVTTSSGFSLLTAQNPSRWRVVGLLCLFLSALIVSISQIYNWIVYRNKIHSLASRIRRGSQGSRKKEPVNSGS